jgi:uncharacterized repeat protein (TIGR02543 family)
MNILAHKNKIIIALLFITLFFLLSACDIVLDNSDNTSNEVTITFDTGVENYFIQPIKGRPNTNIPPQNDPIQSGFIFTGWLDQDNVPFRLTRFPQQSVTLTASWSPVNSSTNFTISFLSNTNEYIEPLILKAGDVIPTLSEPKHFIKDALVSAFSAWVYEGGIFDLEIMPQRNIVLSATFKTGTTAIFFDSETYISPIVANPTEVITAPLKAPLKSGFIFRGWSINNQPYIFKTMPNTSITLKPDFLEQTQALNNATTSIPKLFINLENNKQISSVTKEIYVQSSITLANAKEGHAFNALSAEFRGRGHGSWTASGPKKGYRIKFYDKQPLFGFESSRHFVLLAGANFNDTTMLRNMTAYHMANEIFTHIDYASHTEWVELYVNGLYRGVYVLAEQIRVDTGRVDINSEYGVLDTGYLLEYDSYAQQEGPLGYFYFNVPGFKYGFLVNSPNPSDVLEGTSGITETAFRNQVEFIRDYTDKTLRAALGGAQTYPTFAEFADVDSFVDMYILHELLKNTDTGWSSFYMYKEAGGKLTATAPWDFDASAGINRGNQTPQGIYVAGSVQFESNFTASELFISLMNTPAFKQLVVVRFKELAPQIEVFIQTFLSNTLIDTHKFALGQNFYHWSVNRSIEGMNDAGYPFYSSIELASSGFEFETRKLRQWILDRVTWLSNEWK